MHFVRIAIPHELDVKYEVRQGGRVEIQRNVLREITSFNGTRDQISADVGDGRNFCPVGLLARLVHFAAHLFNNHLISSKQGLVPSRIDRRVWCNSF